MIQLQVLLSRLVDPSQLPNLVVFFFQKWVDVPARQNCRALEAPLVGYVVDVTAPPDVLAVESGRTLYKLGSRPLFSAVGLVRGLHLVGPALEIRQILPEFILLLKHSQRFPTLLYRCFFNILMLRHFKGSMRGYLIVRRYLQITQVHVWVRRLYTTSWVRRRLCCPEQFEEGFAAWGSFH